MNSRTHARVVLAALALALAAGPAAAQNDPFVMPTKKTVKKPVPAAPFELPSPPFAERMAQCRGAAASRSVESTPCPYLVSELKVVGVFSTSEGAGAFVQAAPTSQTFVVKPGDRLFDGRVDSIQPAGTSPAAVVFSRTKRIRTGKVVKDVTSTVTAEQGQ